MTSLVLQNLMVLESLKPIRSGMHHAFVMLTSNSLQFIPLAWSLVLPHCAATLCWQSHSWAGWMIRALRGLVHALQRFQIFIWLVTCNTSAPALPAHPFPDLTVVIVVQRAEEALAAAEQERADMESSVTALAEDLEQRIQDMSSQVGPSGS